MVALLALAEANSRPKKRIKYALIPAVEYADIIKLPRVFSLHLEKYMLHALEEALVHPCRCRRMLTPSVVHILDTTLSQLGRVHVSCF